MMKMRRANYPNLELLECEALDTLFEIDFEKYKRVELEAFVFLQTWSSTALGFGGCGGSAMTDAYTTVFVDAKLDVGVVFFDGRLAYCIEDYSDEFLKDVKNCWDEPRSRINRYIK